MRFLRHDGIYRSDVSLLLVNPAQMPPPVGRPRCQAIARDGRSTPFPSSAMSSGRLFLDRGGRHQSPSPLHRHPQNKSLAFRCASIYHRTAGSVLTVCVSRGDKRKSPGHDSPLQKLAHCLWHTMGFSKGDAEEAAQLALNVLKPLLGDAMRWTK